MSSLSYITRASSSPRGKPRVWFCCHPDDQARFLEPVSKDLLAAADCAVWYDPDPAARLSEEEQAEREAALADMQLFVMPVTTRLLTALSPALCWQFPLAQRLHIPVLPILQEPGLEFIFNEKCGDLQCLDPNQADPTALPYSEKLKKYLDSILVGDELAAKVRAAFDAYIFLSYRKKDRRQAQALMHLIHQNDFCRDIAIWYDEFLTPGEDFNAAIIRALEKSGLFVLAVTPHLLETGNYVMTQEFPAARGAGKPILPVEMDPTDRAGLEAAYPGIPPCAEAATLPAGLQAALRGLALRENDADPAHTYFIGLAYLAGIDVEVDKKRGGDLICDAARRGLPEAMEKLVAMYRTGDGMARDYTAAARWQRILADERRAEWESRPDEGHFLAYADALWELGDQYNQLSARAAARAVWEEDFQSLATQGIKIKFDTAQRYQSVCCNKLGDLCLAEGDLSTARSWFKKSMELFRTIANKSGTVQARLDLALSCNRLGDVCQAEGDLPAARRWFEESLKLNRALVDEADMSEARRNLAACCIHLGDLCEAEGDLSAAQSWFEESKALDQALTDETGTLQARLSLSVDLQRLAGVCQEMGDVDAAVHWSRQNITVLHALVKEQNSPPVRFFLSTTYSTLGDLYLEQGDPAEARRCYEESLALRRALVGKVDADALSDALAFSCYDLGVLDDGNKALLQEAQKIWNDLALKYPDKPRYTELQDAVSQELARRFPQDRQDCPNASKGGFRWPWSRR